MVQRVVRLHLARCKSWIQATMTPADIAAEASKHYNHHAMYSSVKYKCRLLTDNGLPDLRHGCVLLLLRENRWLELGWCKGSFVRSGLQASFAPCLVSVCARDDVERRVLTTWFHLVLMVLTVSTSIPTTRVHTSVRVGVEVLCESFLCLLEDHSQCTWIGNVPKVSIRQVMRVQVRRASDQAKVGQDLCAGSSRRFALRGMTVPQIAHSPPMSRQSSYTGLTDLFLSNSARISIACCLHRSREIVQLSALVRYRL